MSDGPTTEAAYPPWFPPQPPMPPTPTIAQPGQVQVPIQCDDNDGKHHGPPGQPTPHNTGPPLLPTTDHDTDPQHAP